MSTPFARLLCCLAALVFALSSLADVWYVNAEANRRGQDGKSWKTAFTAIQLAIDAAHADGGGEIWIAKGVYNEPRSYVEDGVETGALLLRDKVSLYGGFAGSETKLEARDIVANLVAISGLPSHNGSPAYHVIVGSGRARLDGLVVCNGDAKGPNLGQQLGGGLKFWDGAVTIEKCTFTNNKATTGGAGIHATKSSVTIDTSTIENNVVPPRRNSGMEQRNGGGVLLGQCKESKIHASYFHDNHCIDFGGGLYSNDTATQVTDCRFERNGSANFGGGAYFGGVASTLENCVFVENSSGRFSGGLRFGHSATASIKKCRFERNFAKLNGGALSFYNMRPSEVIGCEFVSNRAEERHGAAISCEGMSLSIWDSTFKDNNSPSGAAVFAADATVLIDNSRFEKNLTGTFMQLTPKGSITITNSKIDAGGGKLLSLMPSEEHFFTLADVQRKLTTWVNNVELGDIRTDRE